jgi:hypothetical protein
MDNDWREMTEELDNSATLGVPKEYLDTNRKMFKDIVLDLFEHCCCLEFQYSNNAFQVVITMPFERVNK